jgi:hypothetical protein
VRNSTQRRFVLGFLAVGTATIVILIASITGAAGFQIKHSTETGNGSQDSAQFLVHWEQTGQLSGAVPRRVPGLLSAAVGAPTVLPGFNAREMLNPGTGGHSALVWTFSETVGIPVSTEIELQFTVHYTVGGTPAVFLTTVYLETQGGAIVRTLTYTIYFDAGTAAAVNFVSGLEVAQVCAAVGTCP